MLGETGRSVWRLAVVVALVAGLTLTATRAGAEDVSDEYRADAMKMLQMTGMDSVVTEMMDAMLQAMISSMRSVRPDLDAARMEEARQVLKGVMVEGLPGFWDGMIGVYARHFSDEEMKQLLKFYETPLGAKVARLTPTLSREGRAAGQKWGESLAPEIQLRIGKWLETTGANSLGTGSR